MQGWRKCVLIKLYPFVKNNVNMVGLVDLLRHEFEDRQIFISTHEHTFERFLRYRYLKALES